MGPVPATRSAAPGATADRRPTTVAPPHDPTTPSASRFTFHVSRFTLPWLLALAFLALLGLALGSTPVPVHADHPAGSRLYVNDDASGANNGSSWEHAFTDLQLALTHAISGTEIWVASGVYTPGLSRSDTFSLTSGVAIYGGFAATETQRSERDWTINVTLLSGDIDDNDATDAGGVVTDTDNITGTNSYHIVVGNDTDATAILDGFTVTAGQADGFPLDHLGGGMYNEGGSPTLANVTFSGNSASRGGGMNNKDNSSPTLVNVTFSGNSASRGGGMSNEDNSSPTLVNVTFSANTSGNDGGGMSNDNGSSPTLVNATFSRNTAGDDGGGMYNADNSSPTLANVTFSGNTASDHGGGMHNHNSSPTLANVTFSGNTDGDGGGGMYSFSDSHPVVRNAILWGNSGQQIYNHPGHSSALPSSTTVEYSLVGGSGVYTGTGNINADPRFADPDGADDQVGTPDDNLRLLATSPAIDAGNSNLVLSDTTDLDGDNDTTERVPLDLDLNPRLVDDPLVANTGAGDPPVDMGAYERPDPTRWYVDDSAAGANDGSSWDDAFNDLQDALALANGGDEIWVATGVYTPGLSRTDTFSLTSGVEIYGGFAATETQRSERDWSANVTVLSGDIGGDDTADTNRVVTDTDNIAGANSYHVLVGSGTDATAILDGFTITAGQANGSFPENSGGGMYNDGGSPALAHVTFSGNIASDHGGGMYNIHSSPALANVTFSGNSTNTSGGGMINVTSSPTLTNVTFSGNTASGRGGGMSNWESSPALANVTFSGNSASFDGGGMHNYLSSPTLVNVAFSGNTSFLDGGGMYNEGGSLVLANVTFSGNTARSGGGMHNYDCSPTLTNVTFRTNSARGVGGGMFNYTGSSPALANVIFSGNSAGEGGGMSNLGFSNPTLTNVTFSGNTATGGGGMHNQDSSPTLANVTFSGNTASNAGGAMYNGGESDPRVRNSILWGNSPDQIGNDEASTTVEYSLVGGSGVYTGTGNINADPRFADADGADDQVGTPDDDLRILATSPAIDAGNNDLVPTDTHDLDGDTDTAEMLPLDLDGNARFVEHPVAANSGVGSPPVDMGAYEAFSVAYADDDDANLRYDGWARVADGNASGGAYMAGYGRYERMRYSAPVRSTTMTLFASRGPDQGRARILIDGMDKGIVDFYSPTVAYQQAYTFSGLARRRHTIEVVVLNQKRAVSKGRQVRIDAFSVPGAPLAEENDVLVRYNGWTASNLAGAFGGSFRLSRTNGDAVFFTVEGDRFTWITDRGPTRGWAQVVVDRVPVRAVNLYHSSVDTGYPLQITGLGPGRHVVKIATLGLLGANPGNRYVVFDGYSVP